MQVLSVSPFKPCDPSLLANRANHALPGLSRAVLFPCGFLALCGAGLINEACTSIHVCNSESMKRRYS
ncbi:hypothetical protein PMIT1323_00531 [Prochlorococcus marinus str. MIT 1323]|nr:hypothetical protein PMIT1323_00531 [Prochlorococcus marinus str. MIT 1323]